MGKRLLATLIAEIEKLPVIDTHEHIYLEKEAIEMGVDFFLLLSDYPRYDLLSCGMQLEQFQDLLDKGKTPVEKWKVLSPFWKYAHVTSYFKSLLHELLKLVPLNKILAFGGTTCFQK